MRKTQQMTGNREVWVDSVKVFACLLVFVGHLLQGLDTARIITNHALFLWFNKAIYAFHVQLFFICSGYLFQCYSQVRDWQSWKENVIKKLLDLGIPYLSFSIAVWLVKKVIPGAGTNPIARLWENLLLEPIPPFWYLYVLFLCFLVTPTFRSAKKVLLVWVGAVLAMFAVRGGFLGNIVPGVVGYFSFNYQWFLVGIGLAMVEPDRVYGKRRICPVLVACFLAMTYFFRNTPSNAIGFLISVFACSAVILCFFGRTTQSKVTKFLVPYTMPIFLMHSVAIAVCRSVLVKCGITNLWIHILAGLICGLGGPIVAAEIMKKLKYPEFFLYPRKFIK